MDTKEEIALMEKFAEKYGFVKNKGRRFEYADLPENDYIYMTEEELQEIGQFCEWYENNEEEMVLEDIDDVIDWIEDIYDVEYDTFRNEELEKKK